MCTGSPIMAQAPRFCNRGAASASGRPVRTGRDDGRYSPSPAQCCHVGMFNETVADLSQAESPNARRPERRIGPWRSFGAAA
jgi:hypothetical protein